MLRPLTIEAKIKPAEKPFTGKPFLANTHVDFRGGPRPTFDPVKHLRMEAMAKKNPAVRKNGIRADVRNNSAVRKNNVRFLAQSAKCANRHVNYHVLAKYSLAIRENLALLLVNSFSEVIAHCKRERRNPTLFGVGPARNPVSGAQAFLAWAPTRSPAAKSPLKTKQGVNPGTTQATSLRETQRTIERGHGGGGNAQEDLNKTGAQDGGGGSGEISQGELEKSNPQREENMCLRSQSLSPPTD